MGERRVLVIGSQCDIYSEKLSFLPSLAEELYQVMTDEAHGGCVSALPGSGLLMNACAAETRDAIKQAFELASKAQATLLLAFIGHGYFAEGDEDFYFLPRNASDPPDSDTAVHLVQFIKERLQRHTVDGLVVLLDACYSGVAAQDAAARWSRLKFPVRFEMLTAAAARPAADGCFTRNLVAALRDGLSDIYGETIRCEDARDMIKGRCPAQEPRLPTLDADKGLYLARNVARYTRIEQEPWARTEIAGEVERLTAFYQPMPQLAEIVRTTEQARCVALIGDTGSGKSALAAALARPNVTEGDVPGGFANAVFFISERTMPPEFARGLAAQLQRSLPLFREAQESFQRSMPLQEFERLETIDRELLEPLRRCPVNQVVRIVVDALDRISTGAQGSLLSCLETFATRADLSHIRLVLTSRPDTTLPSGTRTLRMDVAGDASIEKYLARRKIAGDRRSGIIARAKGNWLIAQTLAEFALSATVFDPETLPEDLASIYASRLREAGATDTTRWRDQLRPVLGTVAAAGVGAVLPLPLLVEASRHLGGPGSMTRVRDVLVDVRGMIVRGAPGTSDEHAGVFHQTLAEYLLDPQQAFGMEPEEPHRALVDAIAMLAPRDKHDPGNPLHRYAMGRESEHLWQLGRHEEAIDALFGRASPVSTENLRRWESWFERLSQAVGPTHLLTLKARTQVAHWTGEAGDPRKALGLFASLLELQQQLLGASHRDTLHTRNDIAHWTGQMDDAAGALRLFKALLKDQKRALGVDDRDTLYTRNNIAHWTGEAGDGIKALNLFQKLLKDQERVLPTEHPDILHTRNNIAHWTGRTGNGKNALRLFRALLKDQGRVLRVDDPEMLLTRNNIAHWEGRTGNAAEAMRLLQELLKDDERILGPDHRLTLLARSEIAYWTAGPPEYASWGSDNSRKALELWRQLLGDQERILGSRHPDTRLTWERMEQWQERLSVLARMQESHLG